MKRLFTLILGLLILFACTEPKKEKTESKVNAVADSLSPIMLDDIHYYTLDREKTRNFFIKNFEASAMAQQEKDKLDFIDFIQIHPLQSTINVSGKGPFAGMKVNPERWKRKQIDPSPTLPPLWGVHWIAFHTNHLEKNILDLKRNSVQIITEKFTLPFDSTLKGVLFWGPDFNRILLLQSLPKIPMAAFSIHHLLLLVNNVTDNIRFFEEVFAGKLIQKENLWAKIEVGKHLLILAEPEAMGIDRKQVVKRNPKEFRPTIDHLGFLYKDIRPSYHNAVNKGYHFVLKPTNMLFYDQPTPYTFAITFSPDSLQCEMYQEEGRIEPRMKKK